METKTENTGSTEFERLPFKRKIVVIDPKLQLGVIAAFSVAALVANLFVWISFRSMVNELRSVSILMSFGPDSVYNKVLEARASSANLIMALAAVVMILLFAAIGLIFTHRVVGPLYRLRKHLEEITSTGVYRDVKFREKDYFQDLAAAMNALMAKLRGR